MLASYGVPQSEEKNIISIIGVAKGGGISPPFPREVKGPNYHSPPPPLFEVYKIHCFKYTLLYIVYLIATGGKLTQRHFLSFTIKMTDNEK